MVGEQAAYQLVYSKSFEDSLARIIEDWEVNLGFSIEHIQKFVKIIRSSLKSVCYFPKMYQDISSRYHLNRPTYRILIGDQYAIFFRIDEQHQTIQVGSIFSQKQMRLTF